MDHLPTKLLLEIFNQFLPPLVTGYDTADASDMSLEEQVKLFKILVSCSLVCKGWREVIKDNPTLFSRDAHYLSDGGLASRDCLRPKEDYVKRLVVEEAHTVGSTSNRSFPFFPNVAYVTWTGKITWDEYYLGREVAHPPLNNLTRLDWRLCDNLETSVRSFIMLLQNSPVLIYLTVAEAETSLRGTGGWQVQVDIPDSVTTLGLFFSPRRGQNLGWWVGSKWLTGPATSLKHVITSGSFRPTFSFSTIELRPDPCSITKSLIPGLKYFLPEFLQNFLKDRLPRGGSTGGTLIYSVTSCPPPSSYYQRVARRLEWVHKIVLKTSGSSQWTEDEKWDAVRWHLDFVFNQFRTVKSIDLCGDFLKWREGGAGGREILGRFEESARGFNIAVRYVEQIP